MDHSHHITFMKKGYSSFWKACRSQKAVIRHLVDDKKICFLTFLGKTKIINQEINHSSLHLVGKKHHYLEIFWVRKKRFLWELPKTYQNINQNIAYHRKYKECELYYRQKVYNALGKTSIEKNVFFWALPEWWRGGSTHARIFWPSF